MYGDEILATLSAGTRSYTVANLVPFTRYMFKVQAVDASGVVTHSSSRTYLTADDDTPPSMPTDLFAAQETEAEGGTSSQVTLDWSASTDNVRVIGYEITRMTGTDSASSVVLYGPGGTEGPYVTGTEFTDTGLPSTWNSYTYVVQAIDEDENPSDSAGLSVYPSNAPSENGSRDELDQYIPPSYINYFYNDMETQFREDAALVGLPVNQVPAAQGWLDMNSSTSQSDLLIIDGQTDNFVGAGLPLSPDSYYQDSNDNGRYDPGEMAWSQAGGYLSGQALYSKVSDPASEILVPGSDGSIPEGLLGSANLPYLPQTVSNDFEPGDELLTDPTEIQGQTGDYAYYDEAGTGKWQAGDPIWDDTNHDGEYEDGETIIYHGDYSPQAGDLGKTNGIYMATVKTAGGDRQIVWIDQSTFNEDFANLYKGIESIATGFAPASDPYTPLTPGSLIAKVIQDTNGQTGATVEDGMGTISVSPNSQLVDGSGTQFTEEA